MSLLKSGLAIGLILLMGCAAKPKKVEAPDKPECRRSVEEKIQSVKLDTYQNCLLEGMSYVQVGNIFGHPGKEVSSSGNVKMIQWTGAKSFNGIYGTVTVTFVGDRLQTKSQFNLE